MRNHVFISYRRADTGDFAGRLEDRLRQRYATFRDVSIIESGENYEHRLVEAMQRCRVMLVLIGPDWADIQSANGERRLDDLSDWVRREVADALSRGVPVIPVLVNDARMPSEASLPENLKELAKRQALEVEDQYFDEGVRRLMRRIGPPRHWARAAMAAAAMAVFSAAVWTGSYSSAPVVVSASGFTLSGVTAAGDLLSFQQASVPEAGLNGIYMDTELSRGSLSQKTARILGANQTQAGKIEIWTTNIDGPGEPCRTNLDLEPDPPGQSLDLRLSAPPSDKPVFVLGVLSGNIRISQLTTARDAAESGNPGCAKQVTAAARTYLVSQAPLALIAPAPAEARFQFRSDRPIRDPFPVFSLSGLRARQVSSDGSRWPRGLWLGRDAIHLDRVAVFQGRIELTMRSTVSGWLWPLLCCGNLVLLFLSYRFNGLPVPGLRYG